MRTSKTHINSQNTHNTLTQHTHTHTETPTHTISFSYEVLRILINWSFFVARSAKEETKGFVQKCEKDVTFGKLLSDSCRPSVC